MKKVLSVILALALVLSLAACGGNDAKESSTAGTTAAAEKTTEAAKTTEAENTTAAEEDTEPAGPVEYVRGDDDEIYYSILGDYEEMAAAAKAEPDDNARFVLYAQAEAYLLDQAVMIPTTTQNGAYTISRIAPRTVPYVQWGNDDDRLKSLVVTADEFITKEERADLLQQWSDAVAGKGTYDPAAYLTSKGHKLATDYTYTFSTTPVTIDWLNTSSQSDTEITVNCVDGLVEYNNLGQMMPALAESWELSADQKVYTFHLRKGVKWYTSEGTEYAELTAQDFVSGIHHMLDAQAGLEWLLQGVVLGVDEYLNGESFDGVGYKAVDDYTLEITLCNPTAYFMTMLTYSCFLPICTSFYEAHGGVYGMEEYAEASADTDTYTYGKATDVASQVYCGPYLLQKLVDKSEILVVKNKNYYGADKVTMNSIKWVYDAGEDPVAYYNDVCNGVYAGATLSAATGILDLAKADGNYDKYSYISDTTSTTYFGGINLNRGTFALESGACASNKTEQQKIDTETAMMNINFRKALLFAFDRGTVNATSRGEDLKYTNLRNMYTHPQFVQLSADTTDADGHKFAAGTFYGDMVQYYLEQAGSHVQVKDGIDGWFNLEEAQKYIKIAAEELDVEWPIQIDVGYYSGSTSQVAQQNAYKEVIEKNLAGYVTVNLIEATDSADYYAVGYRASNGEALGQDFFYGSGWGPDYGDPSTYLDTFLGQGAGYMTKVIGLY